MLLVQLTGGGGLVNWLPYLLLFVQMTGCGGIREGRGEMQNRGMHHEVGWGSGVSLLDRSKCMLDRILC